MILQTRRSTFELIQYADCVTLWCADRPVVSLSPSDARVVAEELALLAQVLSGWAEIELCERSMAGSQSEDSP